MIKTPRRSAVFTAALAALCVTAPVQGKHRSFESSTIPGYPGVLGEYVQIPGADAPGTPDPLNTASYLRVRSASDGLVVKPAHAVVIAQPGFASTPGIWMNIAAQLVHKASQQTCEEGNGKARSARWRERPTRGRGAACRLEVWVMDRRGSQLEDTAGLRDARADENPEAALSYYFGQSILGSDPERPGQFPIGPSDSFLERDDATFQPLQQADVPFMADWGFETMARDVDALIDMLSKYHQADNIFLAGHSQGGGFVSLYAGRMRPDGRRGDDALAGLIFLDGGPSAGTQPAPSEEEVNGYLATVEQFRSGVRPVFGTAIGDIIIGPGSGAANAVRGLYGFYKPDEESIFAPAAIGDVPYSPAGDAFLRQLRHTNRADVAMSFDTDPVPGGALQTPILSFLTSSLGKLDFTPVPGTEGLCDSQTPEDAMACPPSPEQIDPTKVYGWLEGGGKGAVEEPSNSDSIRKAMGWGPSRTNVRPVTLEFPVSGRLTIDAGEMNHLTWYQSQRYDTDMSFLGNYQRVDIEGVDVDIDIDRSVIDSPVYVARQGVSATNPFPLVTDFTNINGEGVTQTEQASELTPVDPAVNAAIYRHSDFMMADDSLAGDVTPGQPGASVVGNTLVDWILTRAEGKAVMPQPYALGVRPTR